MRRRNRELMGGTKVGRLALVSAGPRTARGQFVWICACDCGAEVTVPEYNLLNGNTRSCGCLKMRSGPAHPEWKGGMLVPGSMMTKIRGYARERCFPCTLTVSYLEKLWKKQGGICAISGVKLRLAPKRVDYERTASLDRINNSRGYVRGNVQWVHKFVNSMKSDRSMAELVFFCQAISRVQSQRTSASVGS